MASEALARAVHFALNPHPPPTDAGSSADSELYSLPMVRDAEKCWRRIVLRQLLCWRVACHQVLLTELVDLEPKRTSVEAAPVSEVPRRVVTRTELFLRTKLTPGKGWRDGFIPAEECRHREGAEHLDVTPHRIRCVVPQSFPTHPIPYPMHPALPM